MVGGLSQGGISRVRANHLLTAILTAEVSFGSFVCIRVGSKLGRFSGGDPTFDPQGRQSGGEQT